MADGNSEFPTVLGPDANFKGELSFEKGLRLMGRFEGMITSPGRIHIAKEAKMKADCEAGAIIVEGEVQGNLQANDRIELKNSARYDGDLRSTKLVVEEGAVFNGHVTVGPDTAKPRSPQERERERGERERNPGQGQGDRRPAGAGVNANPNGPQPQPARA